MPVLKEKVYKIEIPKSRLEYLIEYTNKDIYFWKKKKVSSFEKRATETNELLKKQYKEQSGQMEIF